MTNKFSFNTSIFDTLQEDDFVSKIAKEVCDDDLIKKIIKQRQEIVAQAKLKNIKKSLSGDLWHKLLTCYAMLRCCNKSSRAADHISNASINDVNAQSQSTCSSITGCVTILFFVVTKQVLIQKKSSLIYLLIYLIKI
jgi:hypothetical protein